MIDWDNARWEGMDRYVEIKTESVRTIEGGFDLAF